MTNWEQTQPLYWSPDHLARTSGAPDLSPGNPNRQDTPIMAEADAEPTNQPTWFPQSSQTPTIFHHPALEGFRLLQRKEENAFFDIWGVGAPGGQVKVLHHCFKLNPRQAAQGIIRLQSLSHSGLLPLEFLCGYGDQALFLGAAHDHTLRDIFARYWKRGFPGIPQDELLDYLCQTAETLDSLYEKQGLFHLLLNPGRLVLKNNQFFLKDFGLAQLLWMPDKWLPPLINSRYCAPEFLKRSITPKSDQYSLALIYAEMRTGTHPFARQSFKPSPNPDLELLSSAEREVIKRALNPQAYARFPSCRELMKGLLSASGLSGADYGSYSGNELAAGEGVQPADLQIIPATEDFLRTLNEENLGSRRLGHTGEFPFITQPGETLEHTCLVRMDLELLLIHLERLLVHWKATYVERRHEVIFFNLGEPTAVSPRTPPSAFPLKVRIELRPASHPRHGVFHAVHLRIRPDTFRPIYSPELLEELALAFVRSFRELLGAVPDLRNQPRWDCSHPLRILPADHNLRLLHAVEGTGKDISANGIGFFAAGWLPAAQIYLHLPWLTGFADRAVRATVVRCIPREDGLFEIGAIFE